MVLAISVEEAASAAGGIDNKAAGRRLFAGKAGGDRREVVAQRLIDGFTFGQQHGFVLRGKARNVTIQHCAEQAFFIHKFRIQGGGFCSCRLDQIGERGRLIAVLPEECHGFVQRRIPVEHLRSATAFLAQL